MPNQMKLVEPTWPLHAGDQTADGDGPVWVAADESGSSGEDLSNPNGVFAHAAVRIDDETAAPILAELRRIARATQAPEAKFTQFTKHRRGREVLADALAPGGALAGLVTIGVADKRYLIVTHMIDMLVEEYTHEQGINLYADGKARQLAITLFRDGPRGLGEQWEPLIQAFLSLARTTQRGCGDRETVESFFARVDQARSRCHRRSVDHLLDLLMRTRDYADYLVLAAANRKSTWFPSIDPLVTILPMTLSHVFAQHGPVRFLHDEQNVLTPQFLQVCLPLLWHVHPDFAGHVPRSRVAQFWTGRSHDHPSIQIADLAAAAGRVVTESQLGKSTKPNDVEVADSLRESVLPLIRERVTAE